MKSFLSILFLTICCSAIGYSQANRTIYSQNDTIILVDTNLNVIIDDLTITTNCPQEKDSNLVYILDGLLLTSKDFYEIGKIGTSCKIKLKEKHVNLKSRFVYLINGERVKYAKRRKELKLMNDKFICKFKAYTPNEALEAFNIQTKHGLIEIEECEKKKK